MTSSRILVTDDEPALADAVGYALRAEGFVVELAADAASTLKVVRGCSHDLLLLHLRLPDL